MSAQATQSRAGWGIDSYNTNSVWAGKYIGSKDYDTESHVTRAMMVDVARMDGGRVVLDHPDDNGIVV